MDGVRSSFTFSEELMRRTSYATAFAGNLRVDDKEERMFEDMVIELTLLTRGYHGFFRWGHETDGHDNLCAIVYGITIILYCDIALTYVHTRTCCIPLPYNHSTNFTSSVRSNEITVNKWSDSSRL